jgi:hypothetical protein
VVQDFLTPGMLTKLCVFVKSLCKLGSESSDQNQLNHPVKHLGMINFFGHHIIPLSAPKSFASYTALGAIFSQQYKPKHMKIRMSGRKSIKHY